ncbi:TMEM165/GDT1 family protein [uncultured Parasphingorhabdus sp.]|uniref:TMEM165/GDT1 family protein n=1 Tax=uncultured Parasphingorhabdus sp. TaxID=2709694 RepID=UPI0030DDC47D
MDAFLTSLFTMALAEFGDRPQILCAALAMRYGRISPVIWGLGLATLCNCAISAVAGSAVNQWISEEPLQLFYALSLIFAGVGMIAWRRPTDLLEGWSIGPFWTSFLGLFILQFGDKGQFILAATAARTDMGIFAAAGGWIGVMIACVPAILLRQRLADAVPMQAVRLFGAAGFLLIGSVLALSAWGIF